MAAGLVAAAITAASKAEVAVATRAAVDLAVAAATTMATASRQVTMARPFRPATTEAIRDMAAVDLI
jgi:hypothetical protein